MSQDNGRMSPDRIRMAARTLRLLSMKFNYKDTLALADEMLALAEPVSRPVSGSNDRRQGVASRSLWDRTERRAVSPVVDEEFVRVPREPTGVMRVMGGDQIQELHGAVSYDYLAMRVYKVMLAAMSSPPDSP